MAAESLQAKRYAQAAFEIARAQNEFDIWLRDLQRIGVMGEDSRFVSSMQDPRFLIETKANLLREHLKGLNPLVLNLVLLLTNKGKFGLITDIYSEYVSLVNEYRGIVKAEVTTAIPLEEREKTDLVQRLQAFTGKRIILSAEVDPDIIGGMIVKVGGKLIDGSTSSRLAALKNELAGAGR